MKTSSNITPSSSKKIPIKLKISVILYKILASIGLSVADKIALKLFYTSYIPNKPTPPQLALCKSSKKTKIEINNHSFWIRRWGTGTKKAILIHGWGGYSVQLNSFIDALLQKGFEVISFDAITEKDKGTPSSLIDFIALLGAVMEKENSNIDLLLGHSMGGVVATHFAFDERVKALGVISCPATAEVIMTNFKKELGATNKTITAIRKQIVDNYGKSIDDYFPDKMFKYKKPSIPSLLIHDDFDRQVSINQHLQLKELLPNNTSFVSTKWGHTKVLENPACINQLNSFLSQSQSTIS